MDWKEGRDELYRQLIAMGFGVVSRFVFSLVSRIFKRKDEKNPD